VDGYYDPLLAMLRHTVEEGFMRAPYLDMLQVNADPVKLIESLKAYIPPLVDRWPEKRDAV
jgi:hypothetical protein